MVAGPVQLNAPGLRAQRRQRRHQRARTQYLDGVHVRHKVAHVGVGGVEHHLLRLTGLHDAPTVHDGDVVAQFDRFVQVVADEDDGFFQLLLQLQTKVLLD